MTNRYRTTSDGVSKGLQTIKSITPDSITIRTRATPFGLTLHLDQVGWEDCAGELHHGSTWLEPEFVEQAQEDAKTIEAYAAELTVAQLHTATRLIGGQAPFTRVRSDAVTSFVLAYGDRRRPTRYHPPGTEPSAAWFAWKKPGAS